MEKIEMNLDDYVKEQEEYQYMKSALKEIKAILYGIEVPGQEYNTKENDIKSVIESLEREVSL